MTLTRIFFVGVLMMLCFAAFVTATSAQQATASEVTEGRKLPLKQQLLLGLKAVTKEDKEFINLVVLKVEQGVLPRPLVDSTFLWARERATRQSPSIALRPMVYFRPGLIARAKAMHIAF
ncbi:MAG: hypothetical protein SH868_20490 [Bythopirellula sp.]|nr:hypothetical protein [Bythopirellula sp.]